MDRIIKQNKRRDSFLKYQDKINLFLEKAKQNEKMLKELFTTRTAQINNQTFTKFGNAI